jgi:PmbA protein
MLVTQRRVDAGLPSAEQLESIAQRMLEEAARRGATAAEAALSVASGLSVTVRKAAVDTLEHQRDRSLGVTVYLGQRQGAASTSDFSDRSLIATVEAALAIARHTSEDPAQGLADPERMAQAQPDLDLYHPWELDAERAIELATECEAAAFAVDPRIDNSDGASVSTTQATRVYANTHGFVGTYRSTRHGLSCMMVARDAHGMQRDYWYSVHRHPEGLLDAASVGRLAGEHTLRRLGARRVRTCRVPVVFAPSMARGLIGHLVAAVSGGSLYRKASFLCDALGKAVMASGLSLTEEPHLPRGLASAAFDQEGVATARRELVSNGVLQGYVLGSYSARKLGMASTGNAGGIHNLILPAGDNDLDGLLRTMGRGLLVTEMMGQGANLLTGDYSRGAAGFWVEEGAIAYPVEEITVAGNLREMLMEIVAVGSDVDCRGAIQCGSLLIDGLTVAGE